MFWETVPGLVASWAAAVAASLYLASKLWHFLRVGRQVTTAVLRLTEIGARADWPNGSETLPEAINEIYNRQGETHDLVKTHLEESKQVWVHHLEEWHGQAHEEEW